MKRWAIFNNTDTFNLYIFRFFFGMIAALQFNTFRELIPKYSILPYHLTYDFFGWIRPLEATAANIVYPLLILASVLFSFGVLFRMNAVLIFTGLSYSFLVDKTIYNNHYYLFILLALLFAVSPVQERLKLRRNATYKPLPFAWLFIFRFQVCIVYFFGAVNKLNADWLLHAEPMYTWLPELVADHGIMVNGKQQLYLAYLLSYTGLLADLFMGIFLLFRTRLLKFTLVLAVVFNLLNAFLFRIGYFPWFNLLALVLFLPPLHLFRKGRFAQPQQPATAHTVQASAFTRYFIPLWIVFQLAFPLRHWLIPGWYLWDERGMFFSWTMKLRDKEPVISIAIDDKKTRQRYYLEPGQFVMQRQLKYLAYRPVDMVHFAHYLKKYYKEKHDRDVRVYAEVFVTLNHYRKTQLIINPYVDLAEVKLNPLYMGRYTWIVPLGEDHLGVKPPELPQ